MHVVYVATTGAGDPTKASLPYHIAVNGSVEVGHQTSLVLAADGVEVLAAGKADSVEGLGLPPLRELLAKAREHEIPIHV